ncbi:MAG: hypothetical protein NZ519_11860 [Bacteroidia bacterium]|nr:hypothetical protein [Bacteroidia bacterium]
MSLPAFRLRSCGQGRSAAGYADASVLRTAHAPSACLTQQLLDVLPCFYTYSWLHFLPK